jgi:hypothetical protein
VAQEPCDSGARIVELIESLRDSLPGEITTAALSAHSGGGSMLFGAINAVEQIPDWIERIVWLMRIMHTVMRSNTPRNCSTG